MKKTKKKALDFSSRLRRPGAAATPSRCGRYTEQGRRRIQKKPKNKALDFSSRLRRLAAAPAPSRGGDKAVIPKLSTPCGQTVNKNGSEAKRTKVGNSAPLRGARPHFFQKCEHPSLEGKNCLLSRRQNESAASRPLASRRGGRVALASRFACSCAFCFAPVFVHSLSTGC